MNKDMTYEEYTQEVKTCILTDAGNCPVTSLLLMLQGALKTLFGLENYAKILMALQIPCWLHL